MKQIKQLIDKLEAESRLTREEWITLLEGRSPDAAEYLFQKARKWQQKYYGNKIYTRGLIEFTNYCRNDCKYCGIRKSNRNAQRYRLTEAQIMECCKTGYDLGFRTFVLQGGEDGSFTQEKMEELIRKIKKNYPDCALTLSIGERSYESYLGFFQAGADRYLLRHETAPAGTVFGKPEKVFVQSERNRLSDRHRIYGGKSRADRCPVGGGYDVYP